jgi:hypothetical protein
MIIIVLLAILMGLFFVVFTPVSIYFLSYWISLLFSLFDVEGRKLVQRLSQTLILIAVTILQFYGSYKMFALSQERRDSMGVILGIFLLITGIINIGITFFVFIFAFDDPEGQRRRESEEAANRQREELHEKDREQREFLHERFRLIGTNDYRFIEQFVKKFSGASAASEQAKLKNVLNARGWISRVLK